MAISAYGQQTDYERRLDGLADALAHIEALARHGGHDPRRALAVILATAKRALEDYGHDATGRTR